MQNDREEPQISGLDDTFLSSDEIDTPSAAKKSHALIAGTIAGLIVISVIWLVFREPGEQPISTSQPVPLPDKAVAPTITRTPDIPVPEPPPEPAPEFKVEEAPPPAPALTLDESDQVVRAALAEAVSPDLFSGLIGQTDLVMRGTTVIDGMSRGQVLYKTLALPRPVGRFSTVEVQGQRVIDPSTYHRFDDYAQAVAELDAASLVTAFHRFRPLLEQAYGQMGYQKSDFDNTLIRALDLLIATPEIRGEIPLVKGKGVLYLYADPELEKLTPVQKQLLRMGPDNIALIKAQARALRSGLLGQ